MLHIAGVDLEFLDLAPAAGVTRAPPIVLLHEGLGCVSLWREFPHLLAQHTGARVVAYSRYGYGQSTALPAGARNVRHPGYMYDEAVTTLPQLLAALDIKTPLLVGHSDGGTIALSYAARYPSGLAAACVMAPHCFVEPISLERIAKALDTFETTDWPQRLAKHHRDPRATFYGWNDVWLSPPFREMNIEASLSQITCPLLAIQGEDDEYGTMRQIDAIGERVPTADLVKLADCGHAAWKDQCSRVLSEITRLHQRVTP
jgi:pimeloyl-ACP methyl ester carboxylesterase